MLPKYGSPNGKSCQCHHGQIAVVGAGDSGHITQSLGQHEALRRRPTRAIVIAL
jgi:D-arabinose 5-phosphate isomerase GutQ